MENIDTKGNLMNHPHGISLDALILFYDVVKDYVAPGNRSE